MQQNKCLKNVKISKRWAKQINLQTWLKLCIFKIMIYQPLSISFKDEVFLKLKGKNSTTLIWILKTKVATIGNHELKL